MTRQFKEIDQFIKNAGIVHLNKMQQSAIKSIESDKDVILSAPTGSGKTIAFLCMILKLIPSLKTGTFAMIVTPTRELTLQITDVFQKMRTGLKITACYGGHKRDIEENNLTESPVLVVGTPGRICDHLRRKNIKSSTIRVLVLDEYDKSMEMGFEEEMNFIFESLPNLERRILVSATPSAALPRLINPENAIKLEFHREEDSRLNISKLVFISEAEKKEALFQLICTIGNRKTIIFVNEKDTISDLSEFLRQKGIHHGVYHGSMEQRYRETSITRFRNGSDLFLLSTDLAGRGLDISNVRFIIHYDLPETERVFIHRNGRTARMDASGEAVVLIEGGTPLPSFLPEDIENFRIVPGKPVPDKTEWGTLYISGGRKDKINKVDIAGFLMHQAGLKREDTGLIEVKDFYSFAAVRKSKMNRLLGAGKVQKIKNKKVKIEAAR